MRKRLPENIPMESSGVQRDAEAELNIPEYNFEDGAEYAISRINHLLEHQQFVVVAFSAPGAQVGKSRLMLELLTKLFAQGIAGAAAHDFEDIITINSDFSDHPLSMGVGGKMVFIFDQAHWNAVDINDHEVLRRFYDKRAKTALKKIGYEVNGVDLWIGIFRPDKPFITHTVSGVPARPIADILINNEKAKN
jgi:hypothetical protein